MALTYSQRQALLSNARQKNAAKVALQSKTIKSNATFGKKIEDTFEEAFGNVIFGALKGLEGVYDFGDTLFSKNKEEAKKRVSYDWSEDNFGKYIEINTKDSYSKEMGQNGQNIYQGVTQGIGQMLPNIALSFIPVVGTAVSLGTLGVSAAGMSVEEAFQNDADYEKAVLYGVLSGGVEIGTEMIGGGLTKGVFGKGFVDDVADRVIKNKVFKLAFDIAEEGVEEAIATAVNPLFKKATYDPENSEFGTPEHAKQIFEDAIIGSLTSIVVGGAERALTTKTAKVAEQQSEINVLEKQRSNLEAKGKLTEKIEDSINLQIYEAKNEQSKLLVKMNAEKRARNLKSGLTGFTPEGLIDTKAKAEYKNKGAVSSNLRAEGTTLKYETSESNLEQNELKYINAVNKISGTKVKIAKVSGMDENTPTEYDPTTNILYINEKAKVTSKEMTYAFMAHEVTHSAEGTIEYMDFANRIIGVFKNTKNDNFSKNLIGQTYEELKESLSKDYADQIKQINAKETDPKKAKERADYIIATEVVSNYSEILFSNEEFIEKMARDDSTLTKRILNWIKDKIKIFKNSGSKNQTEFLEFLRKAENLYIKALKNSVGGVDLNQGRKLIGGENSGKSINKALEMKKQGKSAKEIYDETLWFESAEGKWKFWIDDSKADFNFEFFFDNLSFELNEAEPIEGDIYKLSDILKHEKIYELYPFLLKTEVNFYNNKKNQTIVAYANAELNEINVNIYQYQNEYLKQKRSLKNAIFQNEFYKKTVNEETTKRQHEKEVIMMKNVENLLFLNYKTTLLHEIQHLIQEYEGFASGGNTLSAYSYAIKHFTNMARRNPYFIEMQKRFKMYNLYNNPTENDLRDQEFHEFSFINDYIEKNINKETPFERYERLLGEKESRFVSDVFWEFSQQNWLNVKDGEVAYPNYNLIENYQKNTIVVVNDRILKYSEEIIKEEYMPVEGSISRLKVSHDLIEEWAKKHNIKEMNEVELKDWKKKTEENVSKRFKPEFVSTSVLEQLNEYDRVKRNFSFYKDDDFEKLIKDIKENGMKEPVMVEYNPYTGYVKLGEGNHRLAIAIMLGISEIPVRGVRSQYMEQVERSRGAFVKLNNFVPYSVVNKDRYFDSEISPKEFLKSIIEGKEEFDFCVRDSEGQPVGIEALSKLAYTEARNEKSEIIVFYDDIEGNYSTKKTEPDSIPVYLNIENSVKVDQKTFDETKEQINFVFERLNGTVEDTLFIKDSYYKEIKSSLEKYYGQDFNKASVLKEMKFFIEKSTIYEDTESIIPFMYWMNKDSVIIGDKYYVKDPKNQIVTKDGRPVRPRQDFRDLDELMNRKKIVVEDKNYSEIIKKINENKEIKKTEKVEEFESYFLSKDGPLYFIPGNDHPSFVFSLLSEKEEEIFEFLQSEESWVKERMQFLNKAVKRFMDTGFIRVFLNVNMLFIGIENRHLTKEQYLKIEELFNDMFHFSDFSVFIDFSLVKGKEYIFNDPIEYSFEKILKDLKQFDESGTVPAGLTDSFRYKITPTIKYKKADINEIMTQTLIDEADVIGVLPKTFRQAIDMLFEGFNKSANKEKVAQKIARFIIDNALLIEEGKNIFGQDKKTVQDYATIKKYFRSIDLTKIKETLKTRVENASPIFNRWGVRSDSIAIELSNIIEQLEKEGIVIEAKDDTDFVIKLNEMFESAQKEVKNTLTGQRKFKDENGFVVDSIEQELIQDILDHSLTKGSVVKNKYERYIETIEGKLEETKVKLNEAKERSKVIDNIKAKAEKIADFENKLPIDAKLADQVVKSVKTLKRILTSGGNISPSVRDLMRVYATLHDGVHLYDVVAQNVDIAYPYADSIANIALGDGKLTLQELKDLNLILADFIHNVKNFNKTFFEEKEQDEIEIANGAVESAKDVIEIQNRGLGGLLNKFNKWIHTPIRIFERLDNFKKNGIMTRLFYELDRGVTKQAEFRMKSAELFADFIEKNKKEIKDWRKEIDYNGFKISKGQAITLYMIFLRGKMSHHLFNLDEMTGIIRIADENSSLKKEYKKACSEGRDEQFTYEVMGDIEKSFTETDREFIKLTREFFEMSWKAKAETDAILYGQAGEPEINYFPVRVSTDQLYQTLGDEKHTFENLFIVYNPGYNVQVKPNSNKKIVIENVLDVIDRHCDQVASYSGLGVPIKAFNRIWNKKVNNTSLRQEIEKVDPSFQDYVKKLIQDMQGQHEARSDFDKFLTTIRNWSATAALGMNPKVWVNQLVSLFAGHGVYFDYGTLLKGMGQSLSGKTNFDELSKYSPMMYERFRESGNIDIGKISEEKGLFGERKFIDLTLKPITKMDRFVIGAIWNAALIQTNNNKQEAAKIVEETVRRTQANYTPINRPAILRERSTALSMFTMYMSEPLQALSMFTGAVQKIMVAKQLIARNDPEGNQMLEEAKKEFGRSAVTLTVDSILLSLIAMMFKWVKKDDDEEEKFFNNFIEELFGTMIGSIPFLRDIYSLVQGYDLTNPTYTAMTNIYDSFNNVFDVIGNLATGKVQTSDDVWKALHNSFLAISSSFGFPTKNIENYIKGIIYKFDPANVEEYNSTFGQQSIGYYTKMLKESYENDDIKSASIIADIILKQKGVEVSDETLKAEIVELTSLGYNAMPIDTDETIIYKDEIYTMNAKQYKEFSSIYEQAEARAMKMIKSSGYRKLTDEEKARAINGIYRFYYNMAKENLLADDFNEYLGTISEIVPIEALIIVRAKFAKLESDKDSDGNSIPGTKKEKMVAFIKSLNLTATQKYLIMGYLGYSNKYGENQVKLFINSSKLSKEDKELVLERSGY